MFRNIRSSCVIFVSLLSVFIGCASSIPQQMINVKINMSKEEVTQIMGQTGELKSSKIDPDGKAKEIWSYSYCEDTFCEKTSSFELFFLDDRLVRVERSK